MSLLSLIVVLAVFAAVYPFKMGQAQSQSFNSKLHECLVNSNKDRLAVLMESPDFNSASMSPGLYVDLIQRQWDSKTIMAFAQHASDDQLATLTATAILQMHVLPLKPVFDLMKDREATIERNKLKPLFLTACDHVDLVAVQALVDAGCFDPSDSRAITTVFRRELDKSAPEEALLELVLRVCPGHHECADYLLSTILPTSKNEATRAKMETLLKAYQQK